MKIKYIGKTTSELNNNQIYHVYKNKEFKQKTKDYYGTTYWEDDYIVRLIIRDFPNGRFLLINPKNANFEIIDENS